MATLLLAPPAHAIDTGDTAWLLASSALVLLMAPGLALFYGGMVRSKSVLNMMMMTFGALAAIVVVWVVVGYSLAFGNDVGGGLVGDPVQHLGLRDAAVALGRTAGSRSRSILFAVFQGLFCVITGALISGAVADRARFGAWSCSCRSGRSSSTRPSRTGSSNSRPGHTGGWLANRVGTLDFAGGTPVEINSGASALALALVLGTRVGFGRDAMRPHNLTLVMLGCRPAVVRLVRVQRGVGAGCEPHGRRRVRDHDLSPAAAGAIGWLAAWSACATGMPRHWARPPAWSRGWSRSRRRRARSPRAARSWSGLVAGIVCALAVGLKYRFGYDDSLDVVGVHLVGGLVGTIGIGLLATAAAPSGVDGLLYGGGVAQLGRQALGAAGRRWS